MIIIIITIIKTGGQQKHDDDDADAGVHVYTNIVENSSFKE